MEPTPSETKYKWSKKKEEVELIKADLSDKLDEVSKDEIEAARDFGLEQLNPYNGKISEMEKSLQFMRYYSTLPRNPSTADVLQLKGLMEEDHESYLTQSQRLAKKAKLEEERKARAAYFMGRKIKERYTPSPAFDCGSSRGAPSPSPSDVSITASSYYMREPTPQPIPLPLPAPPRYGVSTSRGTIGPYGVYNEPIASSSRYTPPGSNPTLEYRGHHYINSLGQPKEFLEFEDGISEESEVISEEK